MRHDFVVIGAGAAGVASAITLAQNGYRVALVEKAAHTAPVLRGFSRGGVQFDTGFHYTGGLAAGGPLDVFLRYLGVADRLSTFAFAEEAFDLFRCESRQFEFHFPVGYRRIEESLCSAFPGEAAAIGSYLAQVRSACAELPYVNLDAEIDDGSALKRVIGATLRETLDALTGNELLKSLLSMHCLLYGVSSGEVSFVQHAAIVGNYYRSVHGIRGGGLSLARAFDARLAELGVEVLCGSEATGLEVAAGGALSAVRLADGERLACRGAVATLHPRLLLELAPPGTFRPAYRKRLGLLEETVSAFLCFAANENPLPSLSGANRFFLPDPASVHDLGRRPPGESPLYLSAAYRGVESEPGGFIGISPADFAETAAWEGSRRGARPEEYRRFKERCLERMQGQIERCYPELAAGARYLEGATPLTLRDYCGSPAGGLYGVKHRVGQYNPSPVTRLPGLFLAGQAVVAPGVMGAVLSGLLACGSVLGHDLMRKELKACC
jgi:all-trans-retinol 13,14-reductase